MENEITESAKAVQEVAKATKTGIEATQQLGGFVSRIINEPLENVVGILTDRLKFMRAQRQLRLADRWREIMSERNIGGSALRVVSPKLALPIVENASLEEDNELQDLWANLLASAADPNFNGLIRSAFIDIIKQLEVIDVHILNFIYRNYRQMAKDWLEVSNNTTSSPSEFRIDKNSIMEKLGIESSVYENSIDNLIRLRCIDSFVEKRTIESEHPHLGFNRYDDVTFDYGYNSVCMTSFGVSFVEACTDTSKLADTETLINSAI